MEGRWTEEYLNNRINEYEKDIELVKNLKKMPNILNNVPCEIWFKIFKNLNNWNLRKASCVCKYWKDLTDSLFVKSLDFLYFLKILDIDENVEFQKFLYCIKSNDALLGNLLDYVNDKTNIIINIKRQLSIYNSSFILTDENFIHNLPRKPFEIFKYNFYARQIIVHKANIPKGITSFEVHSFMDLNNIFLIFECKNKLLKIKLT